MKKKNVLMMALSLCLVAVIAVGGTLAYLTAQGNAITNEFTFVTAGPEGGVINVKLTETATFPDDYSGVASVDGDESTGYSYTNVVPNEVLPKAPSVWVETKVPCWVFVKITTSTNVTIEDMNTTDWKAVSNAPGVYAYKTPVAAGNDYDESLSTLFTKVKVGNVDISTDLDPITIDVAAVQTGVELPEGTETETADVVYTVANVANLFQGA